MLVEENGRSLLLFSCLLPVIARVVLQEEPVTVSTTGIKSGTVKHLLGKKMKQKRNILSLADNFRVTCSPWNILCLAQSRNCWPRKRKQIRKSISLKQKIANGRCVPTGPRIRLSPGYMCLVLAPEKQSICWLLARVYIACPVHSGSSS